MHYIVDSQLSLEKRIIENFASYIFIPVMLEIFITYFGNWKIKINLITRQNQSLFVI